MNQANQHYGPNGDVQDAKVGSSWDGLMPDILAGKGKFIPKDLQTFEQDRETVLNNGAWPLQDGTQYPVGNMNGNTGTENYNSLTSDAYNAASDRK